MKKIEGYVCLMTSLEKHKILYGHSAITLFLGCIYILIINTDVLYMYSRLVKYL